MMANLLKGFQMVEGCYSRPMEINTMEYLSTVNLKEEASFTGLMVLSTKVGGFKIRDKVLAQCNTLMATIMKVSG